MLIIALCGYPCSGKSTLQRYFAERYGFSAIDDAGFIRQEAMRRHSLTLEDVSTEDGKQKLIETENGVRTVRAIMADISDEFIAAYGTQYKPQQALLAAQGQDRVCFASVRRDEAKTYRDAGALIIEIMRPACGPLTQADDYDRTLVDITLHNDGNLQEFLNEAGGIIEKHLLQHKALPRRRKPRGPSL